MLVISHFHCLSVLLGFQVLFKIFIGDDDNSSSTGSTHKADGASTTCWYAPRVSRGWGPLHIFLSRQWFVGITFFCYLLYLLRCPCVPEWCDWSYRYCTVCVTIQNRGRLEAQRWRCWVKICCRASRWRFCGECFDYVASSWYREQLPWDWAFYRLRLHFLINTRETMCWDITRNTLGQILRKTEEYRTVSTTLISSKCTP